MKGKIVIKKGILFLFSMFFSLLFYGQNKPNLVLEPVIDSTNVNYKGMGQILISNDTISNFEASKISVVTANRMNVVYRGVLNPITIKVPEGIEFKASAPGLFKENNQYYLSPLSGTEVNVIVVYKTKEKEVVSEGHKFKIVNIPPFELRINTTDGPFIICSKCIFETTKSDLSQAQFKLSLNNAFLYELDLNIGSIRFDFPNQKTIQNEGNILSEEVINELNKLREGTIITMKISLLGKTEISVPTIKVMLVD